MKKIEQYLNLLPTGNLFSIEDFPNKTENIFDFLLAKSRDENDPILLVGLYEKEIFCKCRYSELLKRYLPPTDDEIIDFITSRTKEKIQLIGLEALNKVGLSTQVVLKLAYYTDSTKNRTIIVNKKKCQLIHNDNKALFKYPYNSKNGHIGIAYSALVQCFFIDRHSKLFDLNKDLVIQTIKRMFKIELPEEDLDKLMKLFDFN